MVLTRDIIEYLAECQSGVARLLLVFDSRRQLLTQAV